MHWLLSVLFTAAVSASAAAQFEFQSPGCIGGQCPIDNRPQGVVSPPQIPDPVAQHSQAIVRVVNTLGPARTLGSGTLIDANGQRGIVITCAHLFRDGMGRLSVSFTNGQDFEARAVKVDVGADLAALAIGPTSVPPVDLAQDFPQRGDRLVSCGYGSDGRLWCNRGQALGYVTADGAGNSETLELSGAARLGDSGGPVFDQRGQLAAVLFGTNGRVVDATYCGRVRQFLTDVCPRLRPRQPKVANPAPPAQPQPAPPLVEVPPRVDTPASPVPADLGEQVGKLERVISRVCEVAQTLAGKLSALGEAAEQARAQADTAGQRPSLTPPEIELPPGAGPSPVDSIAEAARPWVSAKLAALLVSLGMPGGIAGLAAAGGVYLVMRRGQRRLRTEIARIKRARDVSTDPPDAPAEAADPAVVERHHNQYVAYEINTLDKAWARAHAHVGEKYPGAIPYLKMVEGVKDQLLSGSTPNDS
jgi:hypothetical protein